MHNILKCKSFKVCVTIILAFMACLIFVLSNFIAAFADGEKDNNRTYKAGVFELEGYHMKDEDGRLTGYGISF